MRKLLSVPALYLVIILVASGVLAQSQTPTPAQGTSSAQSTTTTQPSTSPASSTQGAFDNLSPGGRKIAMALCNAQQGGCPPPQSSTQDPTSPPQTTSTQPTTLTRDQIAAMKQHEGWGGIFSQMQRNGQIPSRVKNLGQLVSGRYQSHSGAAGAVTITTASGKSQVVETAGSHVPKGPVEGGSSVSSPGGGHSNADSGHSSATTRGDGHGK